MSKEPKGGPDLRGAAEQRTVKCRIALAVDPSGAWCASGSADSDGNTYTNFADTIDLLDAGEARYWVEVEVPVPTTQLIRGEAKEATDGE